MPTKHNQWTLADRYRITKRNTVREASIASRTLTGTRKWQSETQSRKQCDPIAQQLPSSKLNFRVTQHEKLSPPIDLTPPGQIKLDKDAHPEKTQLPIRWTQFPSSKWNPERCLQPPKHKLGISSTQQGQTKHRRDSHSQNAPVPIFFKQLPSSNRNSLKDLALETRVRNQFNTAGPNNIEVIHTRQMHFLGFFPNNSRPQI